MKRTTWVWLLLGAVWGSTWLFIKLGLENVPPFSLAGLRFLFASAAMWGYLSIRRVRLPRSLRNWALMIGAGLLTFALDYGLVFWGENQISAGLTAILFSTMPLFALLLAHLMVPTERMTRRKLAGILVGISGVTVIFSRQLQISDTLALWGAIAVLAAAAFAGLSFVLIRRHGTHIDPAVLTTVQMTAGFVPLLAIGLALEGSPLSFQWTPMAWVSLLYMAFVGSAPCGPTSSSPSAQWLLCSSASSSSMEPSTWRTAIGGLLVILGLLAASRPSREAADTRAPSKPSDNAHAE